MSRAQPFRELQPPSSAIVVTIPPAINCALNQRDFPFQIAAWFKLEFRCTIPLMRSSQQIMLVEDGS